MTSTTNTTRTGLAHTFLSPDEVVAMLPGVTKGKLAMWRYERKGPQYRKLGRTIVYALDELEEWVEASVRNGASESV